MREFRIYEPYITLLIFISKFAIGMPYFSHCQLIFSYLKNNCWLIFFCKTVNNTSFSHYYILWSLEKYGWAMNILHFNWFVWNNFNQIWNNWNLFLAWKFCDKNFYFVWPKNKITRLNSKECFWHVSLITNLVFIFKLNLV